MKKIYFSGEEYFNDHILYIPMEYKTKVEEAFNALKPTIFISLNEEKLSLINQILRLQKVFRHMCTWIEWQVEEKTFSGTAMWSYFEELRNDPYSPLFSKPYGIIYFSEEAFINCTEGLPLSVLSDMWKSCVVEVSIDTLTKFRDELIENGSKGLTDREELAISYMRENKDISFSEFKDTFGSVELDFWLRF